MELLIQIILGVAATVWIIYKVAPLLEDFKEYRSKPKPLTKEEKRERWRLKREEMERSKIEGRKEQVKAIKNAVKPHLRTLASKRMQKVQVDDYGVVDNKPWKEEFIYFWSNVVKNLPGDELYLEGEEMFEIFDNEVTKSKFFTNASNIKQSLESADPYEYEHLCAQLTTEDGWKSRTTTGSGDQGVDVICEKDGTMVVIQCKKYTGNVGNKAVQEIHAGKSHYRADHAVVVTNSGYTRSAKMLANSLGVKLLKESQLTDLSNHL